VGGVADYDRARPRELGVIPLNSLAERGGGGGGGSVNISSSFFTRDENGLPSSISQRKGELVLRLYDVYINKGKLLSFPLADLKGKREGERSLLSLSRQERGRLPPISPSKDGGESGVVLASFFARDEEAHFRAACRQITP